MYLSYIKRERAHFHIHLHLCLWSDWSAGTPKGLAVAASCKETSSDEGRAKRVLPQKLQKWGKRAAKLQNKNSQPVSQRDTETGSFFSCGFSTGVASHWLLKTPQDEKCCRGTSDCLSETSLLQIDKE